MIAPEKLWIGWTLIGLAGAGGVGLGFYHFGGKFAAIFLAAAVLWFDYWYYSSVLNAPVVQVGSNPVPTPPTPAKPKLASTYQKIIVVCDKPKSEKVPSKRERQEKLDQYVDLMKKVFGYTIKAKTTEDEITLDITPEKPIGDPTSSIVRQAWLVKRVGDQLFVTVTNEFAGFLSFMLPLVHPDADDPTMKTIIEQIDQFVSVDQGKCKAI